MKKISIIILIIVVILVILSVVYVVNQNTTQDTKTKNTDTNSTQGTLGVESSEINPISILESWSQKALDGYEISEIKTEQNADGYEGVESNILEFTKYNTTKEEILIQGIAVIALGENEDIINTVFTDTLADSGITQTSPNCFEVFEQGAPADILVDTQIVICQKGNIMYVLQIAGMSSLLSEIGTFDFLLDQLEEEING